MAFWTKNFSKEREDKGRRRYVRLKCAVPAKLNIVEVGAKFIGELNEISLGGCCFRPASLYLLHRVDEVISLEVSGRSIEGMILGGRVDGYRIRFSRNLSEQDMSDILAARAEDASCCAA